MSDRRWFDDGPGRPFDLIPLVLGLVVFIAPWAFGYAQDTTAAAVSWIIGSFIVVAAAVSLSRYTRAARQINVALGLMTAFAPWVLRFEADVAAAAALGVLGILVALTSAMALLFWDEPRRFRT
jgi:hypothetical protein